MKKKVYSFNVYNPVTDESIRPPLKSTPDRIKRIRGEIIPGTEEEVDASELDEEGRYDPKTFKGTKNEQS